MSAVLAACTVTPGRMPPPESLTMPEMALCAETVEGIAANAITAETMIVPNVCRPTVASFAGISALGRSSSAACYILDVALRTKFCRRASERAPILRGRARSARVGEDRFVRDVLADDTVLPLRLLVQINRRLNAWLLRLLRPGEMRERMRRKFCQMPLHEPIFIQAVTSSALEDRRQLSGTSIQPWCGRCTRVHSWRAILRICCS